VHIRKSEFPRAALLGTVLFSLVVGWCAMLPAQTAAAVPVPVYRSPEVLADGRVTLRFYEPNAVRVMLSSDALPENAPMQRDEQGMWSITIGPLGPDYYAYAFEVDGVRLLDPRNASINPSLVYPSNVLHVTGAEAQLWDVTDVPHGIIHHHFYKSAVVGDERDFYVYTPPGYENGKHRYPVLYLLHGFTDDASGWIALGKANVILDNLIAQGKVRPMVVVMPLGYGAPELLPVGLESPRTHELWVENTRRFQETLINEVMPQVEAGYRIAKKREQRAIAGLSMGGAESLYVGLNAPERFAWIGGFSSAVRHFDFATDVPLHKPVNSKQSQLVWMACGVDDRYAAANRRFIEYLRSGGIEPVAVETPGAHTWLVWRRNLATFAPLLFQKR
jgi:enterochelin esterase-like enzyme